MNIYIFRQKLLTKIIHSVVYRSSSPPPNQIQLTAWETDVDKQLAKIITSKIGCRVYLSPNWTLQIKWISVSHARSQHKNNTQKLASVWYGAVADSVERVCVFGIRYSRPGISLVTLINHFAAIFSVPLIYFIWKDALTFSHVNEIRKV